ncbi:MULTISPECIES: beta strand repeat-containing protein [Nitrosomonas]|uniref:Uncharacterized protein n=1 Tax=Nitrosomonas communis TaxID=44574 RepID=A0A0F7KEF0_9PROT|nr:MULTISPECIES: hypothetical protein [Nitrosomonas]AKH37856.1 hypothetical protein AAW31_08590 [Nitrosomonas communis]TYP92868.1 hypothetical protein BCL69_100567 [Nitrosomonas communis]UVS63208.1 hypothetical protein NX761_09025 [Nitrosomonas sp. PLL12]
MAISSQQKEDILALTVATFNAAPSAKIMQELASAVESGMTNQQLADILVATDEFKEGVLKGAVTNEEITANLLKNFGLAAGNTDAASPDAQAEAFFMNRLESGASIGSILLEASAYLTGTPAEEFKPTADLFQNKVTVADVYSREGKGETLDAMQNVLIGVTPTFPTTEAEAEGFVAGKGTGPDNTFHLTTGVDNPRTTTGSDEINGVVDTAANGGTLTNGDNVNGGAGFDTANLVVASSAWPAGATIKDVEKIVFKNVNPAATNLNLSNVTGATELWNSGALKGSVLNLTNIQSNAAIGALNVEGGATQNATFKDGSIGAGGTLTLSTVSSGNSATDRVNVSVGHANTANSAKDVTLSVIAEGKNFVQFADGGGGKSIGGLSAIKVAGGGALDIVAPGGEFNNVTTVDATSNGGGVTLDLTTNNKDVTFTGGAGNDTLILGNFTAADTIDGGGSVDKDGKSSDNDTLIASLANLQAFNKAGSVKNVETLGINLGAPLAANATVNGELFGISNITFNDALNLNGKSLILSNLANNTNVTFKGSAGAGGGTIGVDVKGAVAGADNTATLTFGKDANLGTNKVTVNAGGVETITIATDATSGAGAQLFKLADTALTTLKVTGSDGIGIGDLTASKNITTIDATGVVKDAVGAVGGVFVSVAQNDKSVTFTGGEGGDAYIASAKGDIVTGGLGSDVITLGAGADKLIYNAAAESDGQPAPNGSVDVIGNNTATGDFDVAADSIQFAAALQTGTASFIGNAAFTNTGATQVSFTNVADANPFAVGNQAGGAVKVDLNGDGTSDMTINLVGVTEGEFGASNFSFA